MRGWVDLQTHYLGTGAADPAHLAEGPHHVGHVADAETHGAGVKAHRLAVGTHATIREGQSQHVADGELHVKLVTSTLLAGEVQHLLRDVHADHPPLRPHLAAQLEGEVAGATADVKRRVAWADSRQHHAHLPPAVVQAGSHQVVHAIV